MWLPQPTPPQPSSAFTSGRYSEFAAFDPPWLPWRALRACALSTSGMDSPAVHRPAFKDAFPHIGTAITGRETIDLIKLPHPARQAETAAAGR
jgi:hypothetical protein